MRRGLQANLGCLLQNLAPEADPLIRGILLYPKTRLSQWPHDVGSMVPITDERGLQLRDRKELDAETVLLTTAQAPCRGRDTLSGLRTGGTSGPGRQLKLVCTGSQQLLTHCNTFKAHW